MLRSQCFLWLLCFSVQAFAQIKLVPDPTGNTQYRSPEGWKVSTNQQNRVYAWQTSEDPNEATSPSIMVLAMQDFAGSGPQSTLELLQNEVQQLEVTQTQTVSGNEVHYLAKGNINGTPAKLTVLFLRDATNNMLFHSFLAAPANRYQSIGGTQLFYDVLNRNNPFSQSNTTAVNSSTSNKANAVYTNAQLNMQDQQAMYQVLNSGIRYTPQDLLGKWLQVFSYSTNNAYQNTYTGEIRYGERGYGHLLELLSDGSYRLTYSYNNFFQGCSNAASIVEQGKYRISYPELILLPNNYAGKFNVCGQITPQNENNVPQRTFTLALDASKQNMVLKGKAFEYSISTENGYLTEGFNRVN